MAEPLVAVSARDVAALRAQTWSLLAGLLAGPPTEEILERIGAAGSGDTAGPPLARAWGELGRACARSSPERLDNEYHDLFVGLGRGEVVPYGSWYLSGSIFGKSLVRLRAELKALGFVRREGVREPEDHAAALCETMALLAESREDDLPAQWMFFSDHVASWMGRFFRDLQVARAAEFYRAVGRLGDAFLEVEEAYLAG